MDKREDEQCTGTGIDKRWLVRSDQINQGVTQGMKFDDGKRDYTLLPWTGVEAIVKVLEFGAKKYERDNWKKVSADRYAKAAFRHLIAYSQGEVNDKESGLPHLAHLGCCVLFLLSLEDEP